MVSDILKTLRIFVLHHRLDRDRDKWVLELGIDESEALAMHIYESLCPPSGPGRFTRYCDLMTRMYFMEEKAYQGINTFRGITIEWFKPELTFREKVDNNG